MIEEGQIEEKLEEVVGEHEAEQIVEDIIEPILDTEILQEDIQIDEIVDAITDVLEQEDIDFEDVVPTTEDVVDLVNEEVVEDHEEITIVDTPEDLGITDGDLEHTEIIEIENDQGDVVDVIIVDNPDVEEETVDPEPEEPEGTGEGEGEADIVEEPEVVEEEPEVVEEEPEVVEEEEEEKEEGGYGDVEVYETTVIEVPKLTDEEVDECAGNPRCALDKLLVEADGRPLVLDFQMDTCPPCQDIAPGFEALKDQYEDVMFRKIDIYEHMDLSMDLGLPGAPAFMFWVNNEAEPVVTVTATSNNELYKVADAVEDVRNMYYDAQQEETNLAQTRPVLAQKFSALF